MVSSTNTAYNLTVSNSASPSYTLRVLSIIAIIFLPFVLLYQGWSLYVFRKRLRTPTPAPPTEESSTAPVAPDVTVAVNPELT
jgi:cytochrome bd ubiquinol oxidase subunit II